MSAFDLNTLTVLLILGGLTLAVAWKRPFPTLAALILLIPFRDLSIRWMNAATDLSPEWVNAISRWWFILVLGLSAILGFRWLLNLIKNKKLPDLTLIDYLFIAVIILGSIYAALSPNLRAGITSLRGYLQPMAVFVLARAFRPSKRQLRILLILLLVVGILMAAFEFWQYFGWSEAEYRERGYVRQNKELVAPPVVVQGETIIRPTSTVSGPNELGVDMVLLFFLSAFSVLAIKDKARWFLLALSVLFLAGLALTFSRSAFLGWIAGIGMGIFMIVRKSGTMSVREVVTKYPYRSIGIALAGMALIALVIIGSGLSDLLAATLSRLSQEYHIRDSLDAIQYLVQNPGGVGMGLVEPKGAMILLNTEATYHVEGSLFQIAIEMGVWGLALWLAFWGGCLARIWRGWKDLNSPEIRIFAGTAFSGWVAALVAFVFLPLMQSVSLMVWLWFFLGLGIEAQKVEAEWHASA